MLRVRLRFEKRGPMRFTSHRDLMRIFRRAIAAAEIPVSFSQGFNPHPRFSFGPSLRTGWEGLDEYMDILLDAPADDLAERCNLRLPEGLRILETGVVRDGVPKLAADVGAARYEVLVDRVDFLDGRRDREQSQLAARFEESDGGENGQIDPPRLLSFLETAIKNRFSSPEISRPAPGRAEPPLPAVIDARCEEAKGMSGVPVRIEYLSTMHGGKSLFPEDILAPFVGDPDRFEVPVRVTRQALYVERGGAYVSPMSRAAMETRA
jgi:hypothetical protein